MDDFRIRVDEDCARIIRVDEDEFKKSKSNFWSIPRGPNDKSKSFVEKIPKNTLLIFVAIGSCKLLGMGQYDKFYDKNDEPLININTFDSHHQGWKGDKDCTIQINYKNFYEFNGQKELKCVIISQGSLFKYENLKKNPIHKIHENYYEIYNNLLYTKPKVFEMEV